MTPEGWGLLMLVCYPLLQLPAVLLLSRYVERDGDRPAPTAWEAATSSSSPSSSASDREPGGEAPGVDAGTPAATVVCTTCGAANEAGYSFCAACVGRLPASRGSGA